MPISGEKLQDRARDTALALPGVSHGRPFSEQLDVYKVAGKVFLIVTAPQGDQRGTAVFSQELPTTNPARRLQRGKTSRRKTR